MDDLWGRVHAILGAKFLDLFNGADMALAREEWSHALADMKPIELARGLDELATRKFPPTLGEFACLCRPILDPEWAFHHAFNCLMERDQGRIGNWTHPALWRAASTLSMEVRSADYAKVRVRWKLQLEKELAAGWGDGEIPPPPLAIGVSDKPVSGNSEVALRERRRIAELLGKAGMNQPKETNNEPQA